MSRALIDLTDPKFAGKFGSWKVLRIADTSASGVVRWLCRCKCGRKCVVAGTKLRAGLSTQCRWCQPTNRAPRPAVPPSKRQLRRAARVASMKAAGKSYSEIGLKLGISKQRAHQLAAG